MEFSNLQFEGINMGACGLFDLQFLRTAGIRWPELEAMILPGGRSARSRRDE